jgi:ribonuclease R
VSGPRRGRPVKRRAKTTGSGRPKGAKPRLGGQSTQANARVVWPPTARTETARDAIERLMAERGLAREFPAEVERQAERAARRALSPHGRRDLRELTTFTVDPSTARDFDDAISAQPLAGGVVRVWVHIADVAAYVAEGSPLDLEARRRSTSVYLPGAVEPMLPHSLSSGACSLVPGEDRAAITVELDLDGAQVISAEFYRSVIRSDERLDYEQVDRIFDRSEPAPEPWGSSLAAARTAAAALAIARERKGALVVDSEETEFVFDEKGNLTAIHARIQTESHRLIEQLMIAANEAVAKRLAERGVPCLYRVHERPDPERIRGLVEQLHSLDVSTPPIPDPLFPAQAADLVGEISRLIEAHVRRIGHGRMALSSLLLRSLKQAYYSPANLGHAGLHSSCYCHFTSPIRRYPDVVCHRALLSTLGAEDRGPAARKLSDLGEWTSEREREAVALERDGDKIATCFHLEELLLREGPDRTFMGEITGLIPAGAFVAFGPSAVPAQGAPGRDRSVEPSGMLGRDGSVEPSRSAPGRDGLVEPLRSAPSHDKSTGSGAGERLVYEGMLPVRLLGGETGDWWELDELRTTMRGTPSGARLRLGEPIAVRVVRLDCSRGRVDLAPAGPLEG